MRRRRRKREVGGGCDFGGEDRRVAEESEGGNLLRWGLLLSLGDGRRSGKRRELLLRLGWRVLDEVGGFLVRVRIGSCAVQKGWW